MAKLTLNLETVWADCLSDAAREAKMSVNEYLRQMIGRDAGVQAQIIEAKRAGVLIPSVGKTWGKRKVTDVTEHTEVVLSGPSIVEPELPEHTEVKSEMAKPPVRRPMISASDALRATITKGVKGSSTE